MTDTSGSYSKRSPRSSDNALSPNPNFTLQVLTVIGLVALAVLVAGLLWYGAEILLLVFAGVLLAICLSSLGDFINRHAGLSETASLIIVLLAVAGLVALAIWLLSDSMQTQFDELSEQLPIAFENLRASIAQYPLGRRVVEQIPPPHEMVLGRRQADVFGRVTGMFSTAFSVAANVLIVLITALYFAFNPKLYADGITKLVPQNREKRAREILSTMGFTLRRFLLGIAGTMTFNGIFTTTGLWLLGVPFPIPLGVITALLSFIPNIGPIIAGGLAVLIALSQSPTQAVYVLLLYLVAQNLDGFLITPLIQQRTVSLAPVLLIAAQILFAVVFGFLGLLLAVPLVAVVLVAVKMIYVEDVLGKRVEVKGETEAKEGVRVEMSGEAPGSRRLNDG